MIIKSLEQLNLLASRIGEKISHTDCIFLFGEIGVGKTTFTRSLIHFLQKRKKVELTDVLSPTFNLLYEYEIKDLKIMHYDLYRLKTTEEIKELGIFNDNNKAIKIIEWPELIKNNINNKIELKFIHTNMEHERILKIVGNGKWKNFQKNEL
jgi:tRNA threonylcarbamoyladenosine biosynthesis protein TsaE